MSRRLAPVPDSPRRAGFYIRVSDVAGRDAERFHSPDLQLDAIRRYASARGLVEAFVWSDIDATGRNFARAGVQAALVAAKAKEVDALVVLDLSRLGRNTAETLRVINEFRDAGVAVMSTVEQIDDSPEGQFMLGQFLGMAQLYSDQLGRRWRSVHEHMAREGRQVGQPPIGYYQEATDRTSSRGARIRSGLFLVDEVMGPAVTRAFTDYAAGVRVRDIAQRLGDLRGRPVWPAQVRSMIRNSFYVGRVRYKGVEAAGRHEPLVDPVTFERCQRRADADARTPSRRLELAHSLSGLAVCDSCGARAVLRSTRERSAGRVARLGCPRQSDLRVCGGCGAMRLELVEAAVLDQVQAYLGSLRVDDAAQASRRSRQAAARSVVARLQGELRRNRSDRARHAVAWARRSITEQVFLDGEAIFAEAEEGLVRALAEAEVAVGLAPRRAASAARELLGLWRDASAAERNRMLRDVVASVRLRPAAFYREPVADRVEAVFL